MLDNAKLAGCVALVTGGGGEIGSAICRRFAQEGASVVAADLVRTKAEEVARQITAAGGRAFAVVVDVADPNSAKAAVAQGVAAFGRLTTLVNVAAARPSPPATVDRMELADWNREVGVNLTGAFLMCKFAVPELRRAGGGSIITIASQLGHLGVPERAAYCTTKAALLHFSRILAIDHAETESVPIRSRPGSSSPSDQVPPLVARSVRPESSGPKHLLNRTGMPDDIAAGALYLASAESAFVTGTDLLIDGGYVVFKGEVGPEGMAVLGRME